MRLLNVINSLDTPVCHVETHRFEKLRPDLAARRGRLHRQHGLALRRCALARRRGRDAPDPVVAPQRTVRPRLRRVAGGMASAAASRLRHRPRRLIAYADYVADQMQEPDYDAAVAAVRRAAE